MLSSSEYLFMGLSHHWHVYCIWEPSDGNTQTLSGPLTLIRSLWCLEGQIVDVVIRAPSLFPLPIAGWLALGYGSLIDTIRVELRRHAERVRCVLHHPLILFPVRQNGRHFWRQNCHFHCAHFAARKIAIFHWYLLQRAEMTIHQL